jgi:DHA3 family macrolide efflux protein-like MFS transporter
MNKTQKNNIILFLTSQIISLFGSSLAQCVISWYITLETQSGVMITIAIIAGFLPTFLISPFAGVWADRFDRKKIIMLADILVAAATLVLLILFRLGYGSVWAIFAVMAVRGFGQGLQQPAVSAFLPQLVPQEHLMRVNSINGSAKAAMDVRSPALGVVLICLFPIEVPFAIDVVRPFGSYYTSLFRQVEKQTLIKSCEKVKLLSDPKSVLSNRVA